MGRVARPLKRPETRTLVSTTALSIQLLPDLLNESGNLTLGNGSPLHASIDPSQKPIDPVSPRLPL